MIWSEKERYAMRESTRKIYLTLKKELESSRRIAMPVAPERALCERFGMGRSAIRTALRRLEADGLIHSDSTGRGSRSVRRIAGSPDALHKVYLIQSATEVFRTSAEGMGLLAGVCGEVTAHGGEVVPVFADYDSVLSQLCDHYDPRECSGVIFCEFLCDDWYCRLRDRGIPAIVANWEGEPGPVSTRVDFRAVGRIGAQTILNCGYRRLGVIGRSASYVNEELAAGVRGALAEERIWFEDRCFVPDRYYTREQSQNQDVVTHLRTLLQAPDRPEAFLVFRSVRVGKLARLAQELGLAVPRDLGVLAYDLPYWCDSHDLDLTLLVEPVQEMGRAAVTMIREWNGSNCVPEDRLFRPEIQWRSTLTKPAESKKTAPRP